jgi:hypothetical protein
VRARQCCADFDGLGGLKSKLIAKKYIDSADEGLEIESEMI